MATGFCGRVRGFGCEAWDEKGLESQSSMRISDK